MAKESEIIPAENLKTKIATVREQLKANPDVYFAGEVYRYDSGAPEYGYWTEMVDMIVAPKIPQFDGDKLNLFMDSLISGIEPSSRDAARSQSDGYINLGKLYFDETIGSIRKTTLTTIVTTEPEIIQRADRQVGESREEWQAEIRRRTWVRVYPDPGSASAVYEYENGIANGTVEPNTSHGYAQHWLNGDQVRQLKRQYAQNPVSKVMGLLHKGK